MIIALDLETTGLDKKKDKIIEVALVKIDEKTFDIIDTYSSLINPWIPIPDIISNITNIKDEDVINSPSFEDELNKIINFIGKDPILWHNIAFDRGFLIENKIDIVDNIALDTFFLANFLILNKKSLNLEYLCNSLGIWFKGAHRALNDTIATINLFKILIWKIQKLTKTKKEILDFILSKTSSSSWKFIRDKYINITNSKIKKDIFIKRILKIIWKYKQLKRAEEEKVNTKLKFKDIIWQIKGLESRHNQTKMSILVEKALNKGEKIVIEAPTWIWKTFAYLLPSIYFSKNFWEQVYISTTTKVLQDQIFYKDLKFLKDNLEIDFSYSKLKWKNNYIWVHSFIDFIFLEELLSENKISFILKIIFWLYKTDFWELDELNYYWEEFSFLRQINANSPYILSKDNPFEIYEFILKARRLARQSDIVIINNNILFQDIVLEGSILWNVQNLILDEAHNLEDVITNSVKKSFCLFDLEMIFLKVNQKIKKHKIVIKDLDYYYDKLLFNLNDLFNLLDNYILSKTKEDSKYKKILLKEDFFVTNNIENILLNIVNDLEDILKLFDNLEENMYLYISREFKFLEELQILLKIMFNNKKDNYIKIVSLYDNKIYIEYTLLNPWDFLEKHIWSKMKSLILTSATLRIWNNFDYIKQIARLEDFTFYKLETDFNYKKQSLLYIPNNLWNIKNNIDLIIEFLFDFFKIVKWNTLVLFTAFINIRECFTKLNTSLKEKQINLLAQGVWWSKYKQLNFFKKNPDSSILLWTDTFWEWIDIAWNDLKYIIIHKIPFMVPSDPIFIARSSIFKNSFNNYSIPKSIIKLKQWFWRLIRTKEDKWIVIFLDNRIYSTVWWKEFFKAFPKDINIKIWKSSQLLNLLKRY